MRLVYLPTLPLDDFHRKSVGKLYQSHGSNRATSYLNTLLSGSQLRPKLRSATQRVAPALEANVSSSATANSSEADVVDLGRMEKGPGICGVSVVFFSHPEKCAIFVGGWIIGRMFFFQVPKGVWFLLGGRILFRSWTVKHRGKLLYLHIRSV